jgi:mono/diheme cytochrome c family protein
LSLALTDEFNLMFGSRPATCAIAHLLPAVVVWVDRAEKSSMGGIMSRNDSERMASKPIAPIAMTAVMLTAFLAAASAARSEDVAQGQQIWHDKAGCPLCHGWAGDGLASGFHNQGGLPLRRTQLTREEIRRTIQCGRPGAAMPHFDRFAYTDKRCYGITAQDLGNRVPDRAATTLQPWEIDAVADYVATKVKGAGPVMRAQCVEFFGGGAGAECDKYPERR